MPYLLLTAIYSEPNVRIVFVNNSVVDVIHKNTVSINREKLHYTVSLQFKVPMQEK